MSTIETSQGGLSLNEDGGNNTMPVADNGGNILNGLTGFSAEIQFASSSTLETPLLSYATDTEHNELLINVLSGGNFELIVNGSLATSSAIDYRTLFDGERHAVSVTWNNSAGDWQIYIDGSLIDSGTGLATGVSVQGGGELIIGQEQDERGGDFDSDQVLSATLYDIRLFDDVRSATEITNSYQSTLPHDEPGLIANWRFSDYSADGVITDSVNGNDFRESQVTGSGFTSSTPALTLAVEDTARNGTVVGQVAGIDAEREALIARLLADNPALYYSAETGKFYEYVDTGKTWATAYADAQTSTLNGINGDLVQIGSATENQLIVDILNQQGQTQAYIGAQDADTEGEWRWGNSATGDLFWYGDGAGFAVEGAYNNWSASEPNNMNTGQDYAKIFAASKLWDDVDGTATQKSIIEYDADTVLDNNGSIGQQPLTYTVFSQTVDSAFAIDADTGEITVADTALLDPAAQAIHTVTIRITDTDGNTFDQSVQIALQARTSPTAVRLICRVVSNSTTTVATTVICWQTTAERCSVAWDPSPLKPRSRCRVRAVNI